MQDLQRRINQTRAETLATRGSLAGQRDIANGGDFRSAQAQAAPYTSRIQELLNSITELSATPAIQARQVNTGRPDLSGYNWARPEAAPVAQQDPGLQGNNVNPILSLFGLNPDDQQQQRQFS